jgi:hypothetical protein
MSLILKFIRYNENWRELLSSEPYNLKIKEEDGYALFSYDMLKTDFSYPLCLEAKGTIIDLIENRVACRSFNKFFNLGETNAAEIDWNNFIAREKVDGSLIRLWRDRDKKIRISTSGTINAFTAYADEDNTFGDIVNNILKEKDFDFNEIWGWATTVFELVSPHNRVVVDYSGKYDLYYLGSFSNKSGYFFSSSMERFEKNYFPVPQEFKFLSREDVLTAVKNIKELKEGFVVVDKNNNMVKIKTEQYVQAHKIRGKGNLTTVSILEMIQADIIDDFIGIYPEQKDKIQDVVNRLNNLIDNMVAELSALDMSVDRKTFAMNLNKKYPIFTLGFMYYDNKFTIENAA